MLHSNFKKQNQLLEKCSTFQICLIVFMMSFIMHSSVSCFSYKLEVGSEGISRLLHTVSVCISVHTVSPTGGM